MERALIVTCLFAASSAIFFPWIQLPNQRQSVMNVCIYSVNPLQYQPKCFLCPSNVYQNVLRTCVNAASIPSNITFTQARCIEQNCAIGRGRRSVDSGHTDNVLDNDPYVPAMSAADGDKSYRVVGTDEFTASDDEDYDDRGSEYVDPDGLPESAGPGGQLDSADPGGQLDAAGPISENQRIHDPDGDTSLHT